MILDEPADGSENFSEFINEGVSNSTFGEKDEFNWIYTKFNLMALEVAPLLHEKLKQNKLKTMKKLILLLLLLAPMFTFGQLTITNPDTVCYQTPGSIYQVPAVGAGTVYTWTVTAPGVITSGQGTNVIGVDWSTAAPGLIPTGVSVIATSPAGCSDTIDLDVFILNIIPVITPIGPFCDGDPCVTLVGTPPGGVFTGVGVVGNQFCSTSSGVGTFTITYTYTTNGCVFSTSINTTVNPIPVLSPIEHN